MRTIWDLDYVGNGSPMQLLDVYLPEGEAFDTLVFFHGGGLERGDRKRAERFLPLVDRGIAIVSAEYRMLPDAHFPDFLHDAAAAVAYTQKHMAQWGANGRLFVSGSSAGAWISMMLLLDPQYYAAAGADADAVTGYISNSAQQFAHFALLKDRGFDSRIERIDETAPISFVHEGLSIKPLLMIYYSGDMLCRPEENRLMYASMKRFLPEPAVLELRMIEGGHCKPDDNNELIDAFDTFIRNN